MHGWVAAAPFRSHLLHLSGGAGLPWQVLAVRAGLPLRLAEKLVAGRPGLRLPRADAARILALTAAEARALRSASVPAAPTATRLRALMDGGANPAELGGVLGCTSAHVSALAAGEFARTTAELALRVQVLEETAWRRARRAATVVPAAPNAA